MEEDILNLESLKNNKELYDFYRFSQQTPCI